MAKGKQSPPWRNRIVGYSEEEPEQLLANPLNWRIHPGHQQAALSGVLNDVGLVQNVIANRATGTLVDGHLRVMLAMREGQPTLPVTWVDLSEEEERLILATLDPIAAIAATDKDKLDALLSSVQSGEAAVQAMLAELAEGAGLYQPKDDPQDAEPQIDRAEELRQQWGVEPGQLWRLPSRTPGQEHRIICGDSTDAAVVQRLMGGERATLFATDPPYLVDYDGTNHPQKWSDPKARVVEKNKDWSETYKDWDAAEQGEGLYDGFIGAAVAHAITENAAWYCWHASRRQAMLEAVWEKHGAFVHQQIIWAKDRPVLTRSWYMWQHEPCFFGWVKGKKPARVIDEWIGSVWSFATQTAFEKTDHPTQKPLALFEIPIRQHTRPGEVCYEPFSGSGTQIVAAENLGRQCRAVEKAPPFVAVALDRYLRAFEIRGEIVE